MSIIRTRNQKRQRCCRTVFNSVDVTESILQYSEFRELCALYRLCKNFKAAVDRVCSSIEVFEFDYDYFSYVRDYQEVDDLFDAMAKRLRNLQVLLVPKLKYVAADTYLKLLVSCPKLEEISLSYVENERQRIHHNCELISLTVVPKRRLDRDLSLKKVHLSTSAFPEALVHFLSKCPQLEHLELDTPTWCETGLHGLNSLAGLTNLRELRVTDLNLNCAPYIAKVKCLEVLHAGISIRREDCALTLGSLSGLSRLRHMRLYPKTRIGDRGVRLLESLKNLENFVALEKVVIVEDWPLVQGCHFEFIEEIGVLRPCVVEFAPDSCEFDFDYSLEC